MRAHSVPVFRHAAMLAAALLLAAAFAPAAQASARGEQFVQTNVEHGLGILNNRSLSESEKRSQFANFLLDLTDMNRIARYTLGQYRRGVPDSEIAAFSNAFQSYALAVYQSYFARYGGQTLRVIGSEPGSDSTNEVVRTQLVDPSDRSGQQPAEVDFRVYFEPQGPKVLDFSYGGIWLAETERNDFTGFLGQNGGDLHALDQHLSDLARQFRQQPGKAPD